MAGAAPPPRLTEEVIKSDTRTILEQIGEVSSKVCGFMSCSNSQINFQDRSLTRSYLSHIDTSTLRLPCAKCLNFDYISIEVSHPFCLFVFCALHCTCCAAVNVFKQSTAALHELQSRPAYVQNVVKYCEEAYPTGDKTEVSSRAEGYIVDALQAVSRRHSACGRPDL